MLDTGLFLQTPPYPPVPFFRPLRRYLLGRLLSGSSDQESAAAPRRLRRSADSDVAPEMPPEGVLGALLRVKRLENPAQQTPGRRLLPP